jgi:hypothetical protein
MKNALELEVPGRMHLRCNGRLLQEPRPEIKPEGAGCLRSLELSVVYSIDPSESY